jgi:hypothetical protein
MTKQSIVYDIAEEMARRIVAEARESDRADALRGRLNMVFYTMVDDNCWKGLFHFWQAGEGVVVMRCMEDTYDNLVGWLEPILLTRKNARRLLTLHYGEDATTIMVMYHGERTPTAFFLVGEDGEPVALAKEFPGCVFCQEFEDTPDAETLVAIIDDCFEFSG